jgi:hypothetical protein
MYKKGFSIRERWHCSGVPVFTLRASVCAFTVRSRVESVDRSGSQLQCVSVRFDDFRGDVWTLRLLIAITYGAVEVMF